MADVFISYSKIDKAIVDRLAQLLTDYGMSVWRDTELRPGDEFRDEIQRQLKLSRATIVLWSRHSIESTFVRDEADYARKTGKLISLLDHDVIAEHIPLGFRSIHHVAITDIQTVLASLNERGIMPAGVSSSSASRRFNQEIDQQKISRRSRYATHDRDKVENREEFKHVLKWVFRAVLLWVCSISAALLLFAAGK